MNEKQGGVVVLYNLFISSICRFPFCTKNVRGYIADKTLKDIFRQGKEIFLLDGELDTRRYSEIAEYLPRDCKLQIICGPYVAVEDEEFLKYHHVLNNNIRNWWFAKRKKDWINIHPFFSKSYSNTNIKIFILKFRIFDNWNFCLEKNSGLIYAENQKEELERTEINFFLESGGLAKKGIELFDHISKNFLKEGWNEVLDLENHLLFKPFSIFESERRAKKEIEKEMIQS